MKSLQKQVPDQILNEILKVPIKKDSKVNEDFLVDIPKDCDDINNKTNGWYWIQPPCSNKNLLIFCDFSLRDPSAYYLLNLTNRKEIDFHPNPQFI